MRLRYTKYTSAGKSAQQSWLPIQGPFVAVGADTSRIFLVDASNALIYKSVGSGAAAKTVPTALHVPTVGGVTPRAGVMSIHLLGEQLILLDHVKAKAVRFDQSLSQQEELQLSHPAVEKAIQSQDSDVSSRAADMKAQRKDVVISIPTSIIFAASDRQSRLWIVPSPLNPRLLSAFSVTASLALVSGETFQMPPSDTTGGKPPLLLAASSSTVMFGFREGVVAKFSI